MSHIANKQLPSLTSSDYDAAAVNTYLRGIQGQNKGAGAVVAQYAHGASAPSFTTSGMIYSPTQNRLYMAPYSAATLSTWLYIDCDTGSVVGYTHGTSGTQYMYYGGIYVPTVDRIYFAPSTGQYTAAVYHYIDCRTGSVIAYSHGLAAGTTYQQRGGFFSPTLNRIYFVPSASTYATWYYLDLSAGTWVAYTHGLTPGTYGAALAAGALDPVRKRYYPTPVATSTLHAYWDYETGSVGTYPSPIWSGTGFGYYSGVYSPHQRRIYFAPGRAAASWATWHYIDCDSGSIAIYSNGVSGPNVSTDAYKGCCYSPVTNRIYFAPYAWYTLATYHYIDCDTGSVVGYTVSHLSGKNYMVGAAYSPTQNRIYFGLGSNTTLVYIQEISNTKISPNLAAHPALTPATVG